MADKVASRERGESEGVHALSVAWNGGGYGTYVSILVRGEGTRRPHPLPLSVRDASGLGLSQLLVGSASWERGAGGLTPTPLPRDPSALEGASLGGSRVAGEGSRKVFMRSV